ncbi:thioester-containing protein 1 allele R1-like isoform X3 [Sitodiplosis mosellana]|uniref:thioester-containing protein 1 allele R1-like isoform X3 n=1 Tax=Sitodiplosis mosellana TaxID=263140 RepID=UPI002444CE70|nr:thioester-containing protein 1 allele R1-like isoform X3 [Sitodiplosis mosellana]
MLQIIPFVTIWLLNIQRIQCSGHYSIVAPEVIRPNSEYHVAVSLHDSSTPCEIRVGIEGIQNKYSNYREANLQPYTSQLIRFSTGYMGSGQYRLNAEGLSGIDFRNERPLSFVGKNASIFVQSDKAIYKPGDLVRFRILVLDQNLKPVPSQEPINIFITDGANNRIKGYANLRTSRGVVSEELQLSSYPVLGDWHIAVEAMGELKKYKFEVAEYVLPKFDVTIDTPKHQYFQDGKIRATIRTKYTYGKPVKGEVTVAVYPKTYGSFQPFANNLITRKVSKIDGKAYVEFDIAKELNVKEDYEQAMAMEAIVEEELTGRKQNTSVDLFLHKSKYKIVLSNASPNYKPGLPYNVLVSVQKFDGTPVTGGASTIRVRLASSYYDDENATETVHTLDSNGLLHYDIIVPHSNGFTLKFVYLDAEERLGWIPAVHSDTRAFLRATLQTEKPRINKDITVEVQSTESLRYLSYQVFGRGDIIVTNSVEIPNRKSHTITFLASFAMVPKAQFVVHYIKDNEIISDRLEIDLGEDLQNFVELDVSSNQARPGQEVDITVVSKPNSYIGLLGVDQSVLLLRKGNDFDKSQIFNELDEYSRKQSNPSRHYGIDEWEDFASSGAILLTNARPTENHNDYDYVYYGFPGDEEEILHLSESNTVSTSSIVIRKNFPETWLWNEIGNVSYEGRHTIHKKVPDTITSWIITGFSLDPISGLGLSKEPRSLQVFQPFFVSLNLPYSIKRGEVLSIPVGIFNYLDDEFDVEVTLHNTDQQLEFVQMANEVDSPKIELFRRKTIHVNANEGAGVSFMVKPKKVGPLTIKVTASGPRQGDGVERILQVEPEGVPLVENLAMLIDLRDKSQFDGNFTFVIPKNAIPDSTKIEISAVGDILGGSVKNMEKLIRMPDGCGEQNMLNFVPNIVILDYLKTTNQLTPAVEMKATTFMNAGYQRELTYRHDDGSFSAFGKRDKSGSTWLTAFVARSFIQASKYIQVEQRIINEALTWLSRVQAPNGSFPEVGSVLSAEMQGESGQGTALTAYVLIAFLEDRSKSGMYENVINKAIDYVVKNVKGNEDIYSYAVASYALQLANHNSKNYILQSFDLKSKRKDDIKWWEKPVPPGDARNIWYTKPNSVNVEITSYGLLALLEAGLNSDALPIIKWLIKQRNEFGGFQSTQDTFVGLKALAKYAESTSSNYNNVQIQYKYDGGESRINVNGDNGLIQQIYDLPNNVRQVNVTASGRGFALLQLSYKYNLNVTGAWPRFTLDPQPNKNSHQDYLHLTVCTSFVAIGNEEKSNMAVMEVHFPSGFTADVDTLPSLEVSENVMKVETKNADTVVVVYFDHLTRKELCPTLDAFRTQKVAEQRRAAVIIYDYYDNSRRARQFYRMRETTLCDICEGSDCSDTCQIRASQQRSSNGSFDSYFEGEERARVMETSNSPTIYSSTLVLVASLLLTYLTI